VVHDSQLLFSAVIDFSFVVRWVFKSVFVKESSEPVSDKVSCKTNQAYFFGPPCSSSVTKFMQFRWTTMW